MDPDPNVRMCKAFAHFDKPGWTKFNMAALIIDLSEQLDKLEGDNDFYKEWNAKERSNTNNRRPKQAQQDAGTINQPAGCGVHNWR